MSHEYKKRKRLHSNIVMIVAIKKEKENEVPQHRVDRVRLENNKKPCPLVLPFVLSVKQQLLS